MKLVVLCYVMPIRFDRANNAKQTQWAAGFCSGLVFFEAVSLTRMLALR